MSERPDINEMIRRAAGKGEAPAEISDEDRAAEEWEERKAEQTGPHGSHLGQPIYGINAGERGPEPGPRPASMNERIRDSLAAQRGLGGDSWYVIPSAEDPEDVP